MFSLFVSVTAYGQSTTTRILEADTTSVFRNPCTGWAIYCEGWEFENTWRSIYPQVNAENYWKQMDSISAHKYATHIYIRILWSALEPEEENMPGNTIRTTSGLSKKPKTESEAKFPCVLLSSMSRSEEGTRNMFLMPEPV